VQQRILLEEGDRVFDREVVLRPRRFSRPRVMLDAGEVSEQQIGLEMLGGRERTAA
jgi:hypothetical protein